MKTPDQIFSHRYGGSSQKNTTMLNQKRRKKRRKAAKVARAQRKFNLINN